MLGMDMKRNLFRSGRRQRFVAICLLVLTISATVLTVFLKTEKADALWWNSGWFYRKQITFNNSASSQNLTSFPVLVSLTSSNINYGHTQDAGQDVRFVDSDNATPLSYEIETWDESGTSTVWVKVPQIDAGSTTDSIWMYFGNAGASDGQTASGVWDSNFAGVWHSDESSGTTLQDSTSNANNGTKTSATIPNPTSSGKVGRAQLYSNGGVAVPDHASLDMNDNMTISVWVNATSLPTWAAIVCKDQNFNPNYCIQYDDSGKFQFNYTSSFIASPTSTSPTTGTWYFLTAVYDNAANQVRMYLNGGIDSTTSQTTALPPNNDAMDIGTDVFDEHWSGVIDELRISNNIRSADWIKAEYLTSNNGMNSFGAEEQYPPDPPTLTALTGSVALQPTFQLRSSDQVDPNYVRYKIELCSTSDCSSIVRTIDQTSSQTGWSGQDAQSGTAYVASATLGSSTLASHAYQTPALSTGTQYWWRAYAIDPGGSNVWSEVSAISTFITTGPPAAPTLLEPVSSAVAPQTPMLRLRTTDPNSDFVQYKVEICSTSDCSSIVRTIDQTSSQTGWTSKDGQSGTSYSTSSTLSNSQVAAHVYQSPSLTANTQYWWRAYAIDPAGYNQWSSASSIATFTTASAQVKIQGGTLINGGTKIGQ
jgi:hypothetical protein